MNIFDVTRIRKSNAPFISVLIKFSVISEVGVDFLVKAVKEKNH